MTLKNRRAIPISMPPAPSNMDAGGDLKPDSFSPMQQPSDSSSVEDGSVSSLSEAEAAETEAPHGSQPTVDEGGVRAALLVSAASGDDVAEGSSSSLSLADDGRDGGGGSCGSAPRCLRWLEFCFRIRNPLSDPPNVVNDEATGWAMDTSARGPLNMSGSFLGAAILRLARVDAGCTTRAPCTGTVYGLRPSSVLTASSVVVGMLTALTMPVLGAIVDHTRHRKAVGCVTAVILAVITVVQIMISQSTWFAALILEMLGGYMLNVHTTTANAYLPDLTPKEDALAVYTSRFKISRSVSMALYLVVVSGSSLAAGLGSIATARVGQGVAFAVSSVLLGYSWTYLFRRRPPLRELPPGGNLVKTGFRQVGRTTRGVWTDFPALRWFMMSLLLSPEAGSGVYISISVTYLTVVLGFKGAEIGFVNLTMLVASIPGSLFARWLCLRHNALRSFQACLLYYAVNFAMMGVVLSGPERKNLAYLFAATWGFSVGWIVPTQRVLYCTLTPRGQDFEIMGFFQFCSQIIGWVPPLVFSLMNEAGVSMRVSMSFAAVYPLVSSCLLIPIGSYAEAVKKGSLSNTDTTVEPTGNEDFGASVGPTNDNMDSDWAAD